AEHEGKPTLDRTRPSSRPSRNNREQLGPRLDRVPDRVVTTESNSAHDSTEFQTELWTTEGNSAQDSTEFQTELWPPSRTRPMTRPSPSSSCGLRPSLGGPSLAAL